MLPFYVLVTLPQVKMRDKERMGPLYSEGRGVLSLPWPIHLCEKGESPPALLFFQLNLRRAWFTITKREREESCSLPGSW